MLQAERRNIESNAGVERLLLPFEPLAQDLPQAPLGEVVDQAMFFSQRNEIRRFDRSQFRVVPANQSLDLLQAAVPERNLGLVDHAEVLALNRPFQSAEQLKLDLGTHGTRLTLSLPSTPSRTSSRTGFSTGPTMFSPSASPSRNADSSTRRSKPLTISTG